LSLPSPEIPSWLRVSLDRRGPTHIVRHLARATRRGRERLATDILTIAYLEAGRRLFERLVTGRPAADQRRRPAGEGEHTRPTLRWLTREVLFEEVRQGPEHLPRRPTPGTFRDRWRTKGDFTADLVAYLLWPQHREVPAAERTRAATPALADRTGSLATAIEEVAYRDQVLTVEPRYAGSFRARVALQPLAAHDDTIASGLSQVYEHRQEVWRTVCQETLDGRGYRLRPDVNTDMLAVALTAAAEGLGLRAMAEGPDRTIDHDRRTSLLGTIATALAVACIDRGDGRTLREVLDSFAGTTRNPGREHDPVP
jgi:hypothetical protein